MTMADRVEQELKEMREIRKNEARIRGLEANQKRIAKIRSIFSFEVIKTAYNKLVGIYQNSFRQNQKNDGIKRMSLSKEQMKIKQDRMERKLQKSERRINKIEQEKLHKNNNQIYSGNYHIFVSNEQLSQQQIEFLKTQYGSANDLFNIIVHKDASCDIDVKPALAIVIGHLTRLKSEHSISYELEKIRFNSFNNPYTGHKGWHFTVHLH
jgi:hypothetical protein